MAPDASGGSAVAVLNGRFELLPDQPLPDLDAPTAQAIAAHDRRNADDDVFALIPDPAFPVRAGLLEKLKALPETAILGLIDYGVVPWPGTGEYRLALIYEHPLGRRLQRDDAGPIEAMAEDAILNNLLPPVVKTLELFGKRGLTHRAIRPGNLFRLDAGAGEVILGECASGPAGLSQPPAYEPIESLMADPAGRGMGSAADDVYALGVAVLAVLTGADPAAGRGAAHLLAEKMTAGSYHALVGGHGMSDTMRQFFHGVLDDRREARWGIGQLRAWLTRQEAPPPNPPDQLKPDRGFPFRGLTFYDPRGLSTALAGHWDSVLLHDGGHEFLTWTRQSLGDDQLAERVLTAMELSKRNQGSGHGAAHPAFVSRLCMALDPRAPIRYKQISAHPDGLGALLARRFADDAFQRDARDVLVEDLPGCQIRMTQGKGAKGAAMSRTFSRLVAIAKDAAIGNGIERCLYELNPFQPCLSPLIVGHKVMRLADLLPALEATAAGEHKTPPLDRHIAAFIAARAETNTEDFLRALNRSDAGEQVVVGTLGLLSTADTEGGAVAYKKLARWLKPHLAPAVECFYHQKWRALAEAELPSVVQTGNITALYRFVSNGDARRRDRDGYAAACARSAKIDRQIRFLSSTASKDPKQAEAFGHGLAVGVAAIVFAGAIAAAVTFLI